MGLISRVSSRTYSFRQKMVFASKIFAAALAKPKRPTPSFSKWLNSNGNRDKIKSQVIKEQKLAAGAKLPMKEVFKKAGEIWRSGAVANKAQLEKEHKLNFEKYRQDMAAYKKSIGQ